jgi:starch synthase (maltosyl-transferring)
MFMGLRYGTARSGKGGRSARADLPSTAATDPGREPLAADRLRRFPAKRTAGDLVEVSADVWRDGHDILRADVRFKGPVVASWERVPMRRVDAHEDGDRWAASFAVTEIGRWQYTVEAWTDAWATWADELARKVAAGNEELTSEVLEGALLLEQAIRASRTRGPPVVEQRARAAARRRAAGARQARRRARRAPGRRRSSATPTATGGAALAKPLELIVDRERARFGSWYELFPRSFGGLQGVTEELPRLKELGFDVVYLPPIHPIGHTNRKGRNNALVAGPDDPGSPWAIGDETGGHLAIHPELGTIEDFDALTPRPPSSRWTSRWTSRSSARPTTRG